jgi:hypothetical protein
MLGGGTGTQACCTPFEGLNFNRIRSGATSFLSFTVSTLPSPSTRLDMGCKAEQRQACAWESS